jgi:hypothetical protein
MLIDKNKMSATIILFFPSLRAVIFLLSSGVDLASRDLMTKNCKILLLLKYIFINKKLQYI